MEEEPIDENQDSKSDDAVELETEQESTEPEKEEVDVEGLQAENARLEKVAKDQKGRADKAEIQLKELKKKPQTNEQESTISDDKFQRLELKTDGYSSEEAEFILKNGGVEAANDPYVKEAIASMRRKQKSLEATPAGTAKSPVFKKFSERELKNMPLAELEKIVPQE